MKNSTTELDALEMLRDYNYGPTNWQPGIDVPNNPFVDEIIDALEAERRENGERDAKIRRACYLNDAQTVLRQTVSASKILALLDGSAE